jgi:hypothetical protein
MIEVLNMDDILMVIIREDDRGHRAPSCEGRTDGRTRLPPPPSSSSSRFLLCRALAAALQHLFAILPISWSWIAQISTAEIRFIDGRRLLQNNCRFSFFPPPFFCKFSSILIAIIFGFLILGSLEKQAGGEDEEEASPYPFYYLSRQKNLFLLVWKWFCLSFPTFRTSKNFFLVSFLIMSGE